MGFQLVIAEGKEAGREFEFDQGSVLIGRTAECDVILYEAGVSRKHARIVVEASLFFIEDLGSSNGTKVNGSTISGRQALKDGDAISMGPVVFNFKPVELSPEDADTDAVPLEEGGAHTRIVSVSEMKKSRNKGVAMLPRDASREQVAEMGRRSTQMMPVLKGPRPSVGSGVRKSVSGSRPAAPRLANRDADLPAGVEVAGGGRPRLVRASGETAALSAADRARYLREGPIGRVKLWWAEASQGARIAVSIVTGIVLLGAIGGGVYAVMPHETKTRAKEPEVLTGNPVEASFGVGDVMYERTDSKTFDFEVKSPVQVMVIVHYMSRDIASNDEVNITVNGVEVGWLQADTLDSNEVGREKIIPANLVKRGEVNTITFDNVKNPPENDPWRIWNLWIEVAVLPERDEEGLKAVAEENFKRGVIEWEQRDIGASNRWDAYRNFREAWLALEAVPERDRPATYRLSQDRMNEAKRALDEKCKELLRKARSAYNFGKYDEARYELDHVNDFFPSRAHPCQYRSEVERQDMDL
ncbi:MAG: FHA domain-containing protein [Archangium sp.]